MKCSTVVLIGDDPIVCAGSCGGHFHRRCITPALSKPTARLISESKNLLYKCDACLEKKPDLVGVEVDVRKSCDLLTQSLKDLESNVSVWISNALERGIETLKTELCAQVERKLETTLRETLNAIEATQLAKEALCATSDDTKTRDTERNETWAMVAKKRKRTNSGECNVQTIINRFDEGYVKSTPKNKKNDVVLEPKSVSKVKTSKTLVIVPKVDQSCEKTRADLRAKLDPRKQQLSEFRNGRNGQVYVQCPAQVNFDDIRKDVEHILGDEYSTSLPLARVKIIGMSEKYSDSDLIDLLKSQNEGIPWKQVKVLGFFENKIYKYQKYNAVLEIDNETDKHLEKLEKVNIGFDRCKISRTVHVLRCYRCGQFNHKSTDCKNKEACSKCSGEHKTSDCISSTLKCVNCMLANTTRNPKLDIQHAANNHNCPLFKKQIERRMQLSQ